MVTFKSDTTYYSEVIIEGVKTFIRFSVEVANEQCNIGGNYETCVSVFPKDKNAIVYNYNREYVKTYVENDVECVEIQIYIYVYKNKRKIEKYYTKKIVIKATDILSEGTTKFKTILDY